MRQTLAGYVHLARMIDKCRALLAGTQGDYVFPCSLDLQLLEFTGVSADQFLEAVRAGSDEDVVRWFRQAAIPRRQDDIESWNDMMLTRGPDTEEKRAYFQSCLQEVAPGRGDVTSWADLLDLEEQRPVPNRA